MDEITTAEFEVVQVVRGDNDETAYNRARCIVPERKSIRADVHAVCVDLLQIHVAEDCSN